MPFVSTGSPTCGLGDHIAAFVCLKFDWGTPLSREELCPPLPTADRRPRGKNRRFGKV
jgi:hypothetical protein